MSAAESAEAVKCLLVTHYYPSHRSGVEIVAGHLAQRLAAEDDITIEWRAAGVTPPPEGPPGLTCVPAAARNVIEERIGLPYPVWSARSLAGLDAAVRDSDVILLHDYLYQGNVAARLFASMHDRPVLITQHIGLIAYDNPVARWTLAALNRTLGALMLQSADRRVFISEFVRSYFGYEHDDSSVLIPNGVDHETYHPAPAQERGRIRGELGIAPGEIAFLFVGRLVEKKGLPILRKLAETVEGVRWLFAGWGALDPDGWGLPNVSVFRDRRDETLTPLYQAADLLVLPSKGEGFPLVVQEAMACGTPAMVSSATAAGYAPARRVLLHEELSGDESVSRWSERLTALRDDPGELTAMRERVAAFAREHWDWDQCARRHAAIIRELAGRRAGGGA